MKRTLNEIYRISQKAAEGAGIPAGLDTDIAHNTAWLVARDFAVLANLIEQFEKAGAACGFPSGDIDVETLDARGMSGALLAPSLVDLLIARAADRNGRLTITGLSEPIHLLAAAASYRDDGWCFQLTLHAPQGRKFVLQADTSGARIMGQAGTMASILAAGAIFDVDAHCTAACDALPSSELDTLVTPEELAAIEARNLSCEVDVDPDLWQRFQTLANSILVPATEASRRGAGSQSSDNE